MVVQATLSSTAPDPDIVLIIVNKTNDISIWVIYPTNLSKTNTYIMVWSKLANHRVD